MTLEHVERGHGPSVCSFDPSLERAGGRRSQSRVCERGRHDGQPPKPRRSAFKRIVQLCSVRDRSQCELANRLRKDGYGEGELQEALSLALDCGLVDDMRFADAFIRARISAGKGEIAIGKDLEKHGIALSDIPQWPESYGYDEQSQVRAAVRFLQVHPPKAKDAWGAGYRKLVGKGYSSYVASKAVRMWQEERAF